VAAKRAATADVVIVFATRWQTQTQDAGNLSLPEGQDLLIDKVAAANRKTIVVLETGNPVLMPWLSKVGGVLEAWYPGQRGAIAITEILTGTRNPSGRLPMTFPATDKMPYPPLLAEAPKGFVQRIDYTEGANAGYRRVEGESGEKPLFPFGFGLSYTQFNYGNLHLSLRGGVLRAETEVKNAGSRSGSDVVQFYLVGAAGAKTLRLVGFDRVDLAPGEARTVSVAIDPRTIARWRKAGWEVGAGSYAFAACSDAITCGAASEIKLGTRSLAWK
jgi:beta-glucosidase